MKSINLPYALGIGVALLLGAFAILALTTNERQAEASPFATNIGFTATTSTAYSVTGNANVRILATTTNPLNPNASYSRVFASICNPSATPVYLNMNNDRPVTASSTTVVIGAAAGYTACYEITDRNLYLGSVQASSTAVGPQTVYVTDYVQ